MVVLAAPDPLFAEGHSIRVQRLSIDDGLSHNYVTSIMQDPEGFMWFATLGGLNRYDGYEFTVTWPPTAEDNSGQVFSADAALVDRNGFMWLGGRDGLSRYDRASNSLITFRDLFTVDTDSSGGPTIQSIYESRDGMLWIATNNGLTRFDPTNYSAVEYLYDPADSGSLGGSRVGPIHEDHDGSIWLGIYLGGLNKFDPVTKTFTHFRHDPNDPYSLSSDGVSYIYEDRSETLWIGTWNGLNRFDRATGRFEPFQHDYADPQSLGSNNVTYIHEDRAGTLWIGTHTGLNKFDSVTETFERFQHNPDDPYSLSGNRVTSIFEDRDGFLWVATAGTGLNRFNPNNENFLFYTSDEANPDSLDANSVQSIYEDRQGTVWIGTSNGLVKFDRAAGTFVHYQHDPSEAPVSLRGNVLSIFEDRSGVLWIGTRSGLSWFDRQNQLLKGVEPDRPMSTFEVHAVFEDDLGRFWLGTSRGLVEFDQENGRFINIGVDPTAPVDQVLGAVWVFFIYEDRQGALWLGTDNGLTRYYPEPVEAFATAFSPASIDSTASFEHFVHESRGLLNDTISASDNNFFSVHEDANGLLWLGTRAGLNKFDRTSKTFTAYRKDDGLPGDRVYGILGDDQGRLWISTDAGLARFDPATETFASFSVSDGLQGNEFTPGAYHRSSNGEMYFGGVNGLTVFDPGRVTDPLPVGSPPPIVLTDFLLSNRSVPLRSVEANSPLTNDISHTDELVLNREDAMFAFSFAALSYDNPQKNQYAYRLDGLNEDWVYTAADQRIATYSGLGPGDYLFRVKGSNKDGIWNEEGASIRVTILPPFWQTWWAYTIYAIAFSLALFAFVKVRTRALSHRAEHLEFVVNERTEQIRQQKQLIEHQADHLKELLEVKEKLVTNISHEFRTPLTLILGPIEQTLNSVIDGGIKSQLQMAKRNGQRLLRLVDQLLGLSRLGAEQPLTRSAQPLTRVAQVITESFQPLAADKGLVLQFGESDDLWVNCASDAVEKILLNLLSNALKYTPAGGTVTVDVNEASDDLVALTVTDTGIGIPPEHHRSVFERFHRVDGGGEGIPGAGIGLALVMELAEHYGGSVALASEPEKGTTVTVCLPLHRHEPEGIPSHPNSIAINTEASGLEAMTLAATDTSELASRNVEDKRPSILIIEDNADMRSYLVDLLADTYQCSTAVDGQQALERAFEGIPDLVLCDVMLPGIDGYEVSHRLKEDERTSHIPIIVLTARGDHDSRVEGLRERIDEYLTKPFDDEELCLRIANLLEIRDNLKTRFSRDSYIDGVTQRSGHNEKEQAFLDKLEAVLDQHYAESEFRLSDMAAAAAMSERQLQRKLKAVIDHTPAEYLRAFRMRKAVEQLRQGNRIGLVAYEVGFSSQAYFTSCFKAQFGATPKQFQQRMQ